MEQRNCKNCGAPLKHSYNHKCEYCGTLYDFNEPETVELHSWDMVDVKYRGVEEDFPTLGLIMYFEGIKLESPKIYEQNGDAFISKSINYINPPKSYFCIRLDRDNLMHGGIDYIEYAIRDCVRPSEVNNILEQIKENIYDFYKYTPYRRMISA